MNTKKTKLISGLLSRVASERTPYKPYGYELSFLDNPEVRVELSVPVETIVSENEFSVTINLDGLKAILRQTADAVDELDAEHKKKYQ